jgi:hypothetical protein
VDEWRGGVLAPLRSREGRVGILAVISRKEAGASDHGRR